MGNFKAVIFDLDGTLLDTMGDISDALNEMLDENGYMTKTRAEIITFVGDGVAALVQRAVPPMVAKHDSVIKRLVGRYQEIYQTKTQKTVPFSGVVNMLNKIASLGIKTAVLTNKPIDDANKIIRNKLAMHRFEIILGASPDFPKKPDTKGLQHVVNVLKVNVKECLYVGDSENDVLVANKFKMQLVASLWGYRDVKQLKKVGAKTFAEKPEDIIKFLI